MKIRKKLNNFIKTFLTEGERGGRAEGEAGKRNLSRGRRGGREEGEGDRGRREQNMERNH